MNRHILTRGAVVAALATAGPPTAAPRELCGQPPAS